MEFLHNPLWWIISLMAVIIAILPAFAKKKALKTIRLSLAPWLLLVGAAYMVTGSFLATLASAAISLLAATLFLTISLIISGIKGMPNQRFN